MFLLLSAFKLMTEMALLALVGQWILGWLIGSSRERNLFYQLLQAIGLPAVWLARRLSPRVVLDRHLPLLAVVLLCLAWAVLTVAKVAHCLDVGVASCQ